MIDIDKTIRDLGDYKIYAGATPDRVDLAVENAIKVMKMWKEVKHEAAQWDVGKAQQLRLHCIIEAVEEKYFPSTIQRVLEVKFTMPPHLAPCDFSKIKKVMESVSSVKVQEITVKKVTDDEDC